jgi:signal transduction histidine kinase
MRRSALIFLAAILLPSLGLAWLAIHSVRDQQVVLEHQQAIISQGMTDSLAQNIQDQMNHLRDDFTGATQKLIEQSASPRALAADFNARIRDAWPMAEVGFAVDLNGDIYSPKPFEGANAKTFRTENDRFLSNRENVEVYAQKASVANSNNFNFGNATHAVNASPTTNAPMGGSAMPAADEPDLTRASDLNEKKLKDAEEKTQAPGAQSSSQLEGQTDAAKLRSTSTVMASSTPSNSTESDLTRAPAATAAPAPALAPVASDGLTLNVAPADATARGAATQAPVASSGSASTLTMTTPAAPASKPSIVEPSEDAALDKAQAVPAPDTSSADLQAKINQVVTKIQRQVMPQQMLTRDTAPLSNTVPEASDFRRVIGSEASGTLARFLENHLRLMVWSHPASASSIVFGAQLNKTRLIETLETAFPPDAASEGSSYNIVDPAICIAILDDNGHPVAQSRRGFTADWKHPFVATEIGEALPHWEAALYLVDPQQIGRSARTLRLTLGLIVLLLVAAIVAGGSIIAADVRRQVRLAQQKTDFVSNVSHELKTPLTSIRMFADLLAEKRVPDEARQATYLRIIAAESARLTRLINNVLDFARMERGAPPGERRACDLVEAARDVIETCAPHLEAAGVSFQHEIEAETLPLQGDRDALSQITLNLVSNAEKYGGNDILVRVRRQDTATGPLGCIDVLDRGPGIPPPQVKTIFEPFHRLDDSLASGIPGSGLGLTLARRMARAHGGDVTYSPRAGGGSCFTLSLPLTRS